MDMSKRLTLCILSIFLLAFIAVPVMAHDPDPNLGAVGNLNHAHPLLEAKEAVDLNEDGDTTDPGEAAVAVHGAHPTATIALKADQANVRGNMVAIVADDAATTTVSENTFILVVNFNVDVTDSAAQTSIAADFSDIAVGDLTAAETTFSLVGTTNVATASPAGLAITRIVAAGTTDIVAAGKRQFEITVTIPDAVVPSGTTDAIDETLTFRIRVNAGGVFALQTGDIGPDGITPIDVPGGGNLASNTLMLTLVSALPPVDPIPVPTIAITSEDDLTVGMEATVMLAVTGAAPGSTIGVGEYVVFQTAEDGAQTQLLASFNATTGELKFTPMSMDDVTVRVNAGAVVNADTPPVGNTQAEEEFTVMPVPDKTDPTVTITSALGTGDNAGKIIFTFTFSEALMAKSFSSEDIDRTQSNVLLAGEPMMSETDPMVYTLVVTPPATGSATIVLKTGSVTDAAGNTLKGDQMHTYTPATAAMIPTTALGNTTAGATLTITFDKDPGTVATTATGYTIAAGTGMTRMITIPADKAAGTHTIALTWTGGAGTSDDGSGSVTYTIPAAELNTSDPITIPAGKFVVVVRESATGAELRRFDSDIVPITWEDMPNLHDVFNISAIHGGGALILRKVGDATVHPGTVGISEIMWAIDESQLGSEGDRQMGQWIELHNLNTSDVTVKLSWKTGAKGIADDANINGDLAAPYLDVVTNVFHNRPGNRHGPWKLPGQNGNPIIGKNFVSAARKGTFDRTSTHDNKFNKRYTNTPHGENASNSPDGRNKDQWAASTVRYGYKTDTVTTTDNRSFNVVYESLGTPGHVNHFSPQRADVRDAKQNVAASPIVINEVANRIDVDNQYEWIELRNVSGAEVDLHFYQISILTKDNADDDDLPQDERFITIQNAKIPAGGVLLLVDSDPFGDSDHPLAVGWNVNKNAELQVPGLGALGINGTSKHGRYKVVTFGGHGGKFTTGLPDDGNFILILRESHKKEKKAFAHLGTGDVDRINDIAGYVDNLVANANNPLTKTDLWPLKAQDAPASDKNNLVKNIVHDRQHLLGGGQAGAGTSHGDKKEDQVAFGHVGYTGIGYKRQAADSAIHGGTPGYANNVRKNNATEIKTVPLVISEIMLSQGNGRTKLPQWIEIHNPSSSPIDLHNGDGWRLIIENPEDPIRTINFKGTTVKTILPEQTVLIVSGSTRNFGSDIWDASVVFPPTRVLNVYRHFKGEFEMDSRTDPILNMEEFRITLIDGAALDTAKVTPTHAHLKVGGKYYTISDDVGNLDGNARTNDVAAWKYPEGKHPQDGNRSSLVRVFKDDGTGRDAVNRTESGVLPKAESDVLPKGAGKMLGDALSLKKGIIPDKYSWVQAFQINFGKVRHTWYGSQDDYGTPLNRVTQILPVNLSSFRPTLQDGKVTIRWATESELDNAGFNILRSETRNGEFKQVNTELIQGAGTTGEKTTYSWVDATAKPGVVYYYQIEDVSFAGEHQVLAMNKLKGLISAKGKLTTTWSELKEASQ